MSLMKKCRLDFRKVAKNRWHCPVKNIEVQVAGSRRDGILKKKMRVCFGKRMELLTKTNIMEQYLYLWQVGLESRLKLKGEIVLHDAVVRMLFMGVVTLVE